MVDPSPAIVTTVDVERTIRSLFHATDAHDVVLRVQGAKGSEDRNEAFGALLESLQMYGGGALGSTEVLVEPPSQEALTKALSVLAYKRLQRRLFERILLTFGRALVDPLAQLLEPGPGGALINRMTELRLRMLHSLTQLRLTEETRQILTDDVGALLSDDYLQMLAEHEEKVQRPRVKKLAQEVLQLVGSTFQRAFQGWHRNAEHIAASVHRRFGGRHKLGANPTLIRQYIVEALEAFLWIETSAEISGALSQLFSQKAYAGLVNQPNVELDREVYRKFADACWEIISEHC